MNDSLRRIVSSELLIWLALAAVSLYFLIPLRKSLRFGIDLVGGTYLTLEVQVDKAVEAELIERMQQVENKLETFNIDPTGRDLEKTGFVLTFENLQQTEQAVDLVKGEFTDMTITSQGSTVKAYMTDNAVQMIKQEAVQKDVEVLRTRMGSADIPIQQQGEKNIIIELPDTANPQEAKSRIGKSAQLELKLVEKAGPSKESLLLEYEGELPSDKEILPGKRAQEFYLVSRFAPITGKMLKSAQLQFSEQKGFEPVVAFRLNDAGAQKFYELTSQNIGRPLAIVLDGVVISAPIIQSELRGEGVISGSFTKDSAQELALLLTSGSFVAPVSFEEERQIGPTLGEESIHQGLLSCLVGLGLIFIFSLFYYKISGFFAFLALVYNLILILVGLAWLKTPLTLPGIAGMVLTVGMAIDASILIFEHIKQELAKGIGVMQAVRLGFKDAMVVILDANITTFIVGIVLFYFGTGPIKGFAVTMMLGIIATLISGLFFLRSLFTFVIQNFRIQKLKI